jgi:DNA invertase Pin-like site-specific DNA recombinase
VTRAAIYARVSRPDESSAEGGEPILENQLRDLRELAARRSYEVTKEYVEIASGNDSTRAGLSALLHDAALARRPFDVVLFRSLSRVTRKGTLGALEILRVLEGAGVSWRFLETPILDSAEDTSPLARNVLLAVIAELDRDYRERISRSTKASYQRRKQLSVATGQPLKWGRPRKKPELVVEAGT